jgi:hypothetical protein
MHKILSTELSSQRRLFIPVSLLGLEGIVCGPHLRRQLAGTAPTQATLTLTEPRMKYVWKPQNAVQNPKVELPAVTTISFELIKT